MVNKSLYKIFALYLMKKLFSLFIICIFSSSLFAQSTEPYLFTSDVQKEINPDSIGWKNQLLAVSYSFIGNYDKVKASWDLATLPRMIIPTQEDSIWMERLTAVSAKDYIIEQAKKEEIIILNEAHHQAQHRVFAKSLLEGLYVNGYRYFGLEALWETGVNNRKFIQINDGYYTREPEMARLIETAVQIGFTVFGYEAEDTKTPAEREQKQADNIYKFLQSNQNGKTLIFCGYDHASEIEVSNWGLAMAGRLSELTGINPLTISQIPLTERSEDAFNHPLLNAFTPKEPSVLVDENKVPFSGYRSPKQTDIQLFHPKTIVVNGRPTWYTAGKTPITLSEKALKGQTFPLQILAYKTGSYKKQGVPVDCLEIDKPSTENTLYLTAGSYEIIARNKTYKVVKKWKIAVP